MTATGNEAVKLGQFRSYMGAHMQEYQEGDTVTLDGIGNDIYDLYPISYDLGGSLDSVSITSVACLLALGKTLPDGLTIKFDESLVYLFQASLYYDWDEGTSASAYGFYVPSAVELAGLYSNCVLVTFTLSEPITDSAVLKALLSGDTLFTPIYLTGTVVADTASQAMTMSAATMSSQTMSSSSLGGFFADVSTDKLDEIKARIAAKEASR